MGLDEVDSRHFSIVLRGYDREAVDAFIGSLTRELAERDALVAAREAKLSEHRQRRQKTTGPPDRRTLLRSLGEEAAAALERAEQARAEWASAAEAASARLRGDLGRAAERLAGTQRAVAHLLSYVESAGVASTTGTPRAPGNTGTPRAPGASEQVIDLTVEERRSSPAPAPPPAPAPAEEAPPAPAEERPPPAPLVPGAEREPSAASAVTTRTLTALGDTTVTMALFGVSVLAWALIVRSTGSMRGMATGLGQVGRAAPSTVSTATVLLAWVGVMAAVQIPSLVPGWAVEARQAGPLPSRMRVAAAYTAGFLAVWAVLGFVPLLVLGWMHSQAGIGSGIGAPSILAALLLGAAGLYQFTPWKRRSLAASGGPLAFLLQEAPEWTNGAAFQAGLDTAIARLAGFGPLLAVLLVVGLVNPAWLLILALVVAVETRTREVAFSRVVGAALLAVGVVAAVSPGVLHALSGV